MSSKGPCFNVAKTDCTAGGSSVVGVMVPNKRKKDIWIEINLEQVKF